jgi:hypothetical protein
LTAGVGSGGNAVAGRIGGYIGSRGMPMTLTGRSKADIYNQLFSTLMIIINNIMLLSVANMSSALISSSCQPQVKKREIACIATAAGQRN